MLGGSCVDNKPLAAAFVLSVDGDFVASRDFGAGVAGLTAREAFALSPTTLTEGEGLSHARSVLTAGEGFGNTRFVLTAGRVCTGLLLAGDTTGFILEGTMYVFFAGLTGFCATVVFFLLFF